MKEKMEKIVVYADGGSRGNPGPSAIGVVIRGLEGGEKTYGQQIENTTNNVAEYRAVIFALKKVKQLMGGKKAEQAQIEVVMDSELVVNQLNGEFKIKDSDLQPLFIEVWNRKQDFGKVSFRHVLRGENARADALVNRALDSGLF